MEPIIYSRDVLRVCVTGAGGFIASHLATI